MELTSLDLQHCSSLSIDETISSILQEASTLRTLHLDSISVNPEHPLVHHSFLSSLPDLEVLELDVTRLGPDSLRFLGPKIHSVTLHQVGLSGYELVSSLPFIEEAAKDEGGKRIRFKLTASDYTAREIEVIDVSVCLCAMGTKVDLEFQRHFAMYPSFKLTYI